MVVGQFRNRSRGGANPGWVSRKVSRIHEDRMREAFFKGRVRVSLAWWWGSSGVGLEGGLILDGCQGRCPGSRKTECAKRFFREV